MAREKVETSEVVPRVQPLQVQAEQLIKNGLDMISCGANVPFADNEIFFGPISRYVDEKVAVIPDFISNCGMARVFANLMSIPDDLSDDGIFNDVSDILQRLEDKIYAEKSHTQPVIHLDKNEKLKGLHFLDELYQAIQNVLGQASEGNRVQ